ncbi:MAG: type II toxin-antitoxin system RelE/ParE family toxin [Candidatus Liptonbacteria bacterium]|nr:type II toxin-antitoxin system RelE/ParE family toxin [Candidatus Liptonbacteria bacterium]
MRELFVTGQFKKDLSKVPDFVRDETDLIARKLRVDPIDKKLGVKKLIQITPSVWRVRIGSYRLIYIFDKDSINLFRIRHRKDVYRNL